MMRRVLDHLSPSRNSAHAWLERHPRIAEALDRTGCLRFNHRAIARGAGIGLFIALTPTVGFQTLMMLGACLLLRGNFPIAFLASWISNPLTMAPLYFGYNALGDVLLGPIVRAAGYGDGAGVEVAYTALGSLLIAAPISFGAYAVLNWGLRSWIIRHRRRLRQQRNEAARARQSASKENDAEAIDRTRQRDG